MKVGGYSDQSNGNDQIRNWNDARTYCKAIWNDADLAVLPNAYYNFFATAFTKSFGRHVWIGLQSTIAADQTFHWVDSRQTRLTYSNWSPGQPTGTNVEGKFVDEAAMRTTGHMDQNNWRPGQWFDVEGTQKYGFMCSHNLSPQGLYR